MLPSGVGSPVCAVAPEFEPVKEPEPEMVVPGNVSEACADWEKSALAAGVNRKANRAMRAAEWPSAKPAAVTRCQIFSPKLFTVALSGSLLHTQFQPAATPAPLFGVSACVFARSVSRTKRQVFLPFESPFKRLFFHNILAKYVRRAQLAGAKSVAAARFLKLQIEATNTLSFRLLKPAHLPCLKSSGAGSTQTDSIP